MAEAGEGSVLKGACPDDDNPPYAVHLRDRKDELCSNAGADRLDKDGLCAVDSTTRSAYGSSLADIKWGRNKEHVPLPQTSEVVVYSLDSHMPVYYRTFPGNIPDSRSVETILTDISHAGFPRVILVTDRGYESVQNLEKYILRGQPMIMCVKMRQEDCP